MGQTKLSVYINEELTIIGYVLNISDDGFFLLDENWFLIETPIKLIPLYNLVTATDGIDDFILDMETDFQEFSEEESQQLLQACIKQNEEPR